MPIYDFECSCGYEFDAIAKTDQKYCKCPECGKKAKVVFPKGAPRFDLKYNPKTDIADWDGNTSQYYRLYNEAKDRGENVRLPEESE
jgi:putative FmdB family regulatory protein